LIALTKARKNWGFGLCFLYLRNIKGFKWNHKRVRPLPPLSCIFQCTAGAADRRFARQICRKGFYV
jgi:hypothetical protein